MSTSAPSSTPSPIATSALNATEAGGFDWSTLIIGPALTAALVAGLVSLIQIVVTGKREKNRQLLEFRLRQINELYAPILFHLAETKSLATTLRESIAPPNTQWHLLDHLTEVHQNPQLLEIAKRIVLINCQIKDALVKNSGLSLEAELPASFHDFITHANIVSRAVAEGTVLDNVRPKYFPQQFEIDINRAHSTLTGKIKKELGDHV
ncbi:hypothetical protein [Kocuria sabuli]|uniref:hypothetical protein n=1 Tax=Kocuria sabuli TaxID=3071448 RepID=UPI0034D763D9